jgi:hypothetical protein
MYYTSNSPYKLDFLEHRKAEYLALFAPPVGRLRPGERTLQPRWGWALANQRGRAGGQTALGAWGECDFGEPIII